MRNNTKKMVNKADVDGVLTISSTPVGKKGMKILLANALIPDANVDGKYERKDVVLENGVIARVRDARCAEDNDDADAEATTTEEKKKGSSKEGKEGEKEEEYYDEVIDCRERMLTPGLVNGHTHSVEHWLRGAIPPLPLEMWIFQLILHEPRGEKGWFGEKSWVETPSAMIALSSLLCGIETLLSGSTVIMDHLLCRNIDDVEAAVTAYKALGLRCFIAPMLNDDGTMYHNYVPLARDAKERLAKCGSCGMCGGLDGKTGCFRTEKSAYSKEALEKSLKLWEDAVEKFHDPENGVNIAIGPVTCFSASFDLLKGAAELRRKHNLCGHIHLLETRAQALQSKQFLNENGCDGSSVKLLEKSGFLSVPGTSLAHGVWLTDEECDIVSKADATIVHNPLSNLRLGSGVAPLRRYKNNGVKVCLGADGSCSSDGQDMLEVVKIANFLPCVETAEYRDWPSPRETYLKLGCENGYHSVNLGDKGGKIQEGMLADVCLWDLSALALLPKTDPLGLLARGSRAQSAGAGSVLAECWVNGKRVIKEGEICGCDVKLLRKIVSQAQDYVHESKTVLRPESYDLTRRAEREYRAAIGLDVVEKEEKKTKKMKKENAEHRDFPEDNRVLYDAEFSS